MKHQQTPGRIEALREVLRTGTSNATPEMMHIAGFGKLSRPRPVAQSHGTVALSSGIEKLTAQERSALPF